ncbi:MAG: hypothetical protein MUC96_07355 [Myxococcaceae bacterium]|nr:hypothetical protein [Myxococcaceae bacterium]
MGSRRDRIDLGWLALGLALWAFALAPLVHAATRHPHRHSDAPADAPHGAKTVEHLSAALLKTPPSPEPVLRVIALRAPLEAQPQAPRLERRRSPIEAQGP